MKMRRKQDGRLLLKVWCLPGGLGKQFWFSDLREMSMAYLNLYNAANAFK